MPCSILLYTLLLSATGLAQELTAGAITFASGVQDEISRQVAGTNHKKQTVSGCLIPPQPIGGSYTLNFCTGSSCNTLPWTKVSVGSILTYKCNKGYLQKGGDVSFCIGGGWFRSPTCIKTCSAPRLEGIDAFCNYQGKRVTCNSSNDPGTTATLVCKDFYKILLGDDSASQEITCLEEGVWGHTSFQCIPECGTTVAHGRDLIVNGSHVNHSSFPWHVAIYKRSSVENFEQICTGTLFSPDSVISAAHCFYDETTSRLLDSSEFSVVAGKYYRPYNTKEFQAQESAVKKIAITERYFGSGRNYEQDIAILRLETPFIMTAFVKPICMDWYNRQERQQLKMGTTGQAVWWGKIVDDNLNIGLQDIDLPYVPIQSCLAAMSNNFKGFTTLDKFCAGNTDGSRPGDGDSGGGLYFHLDGLWFLRGITSVVSSSNGVAEHNSYTAFTNVGQFIEWIRDVYLSPGNDSNGLSSFLRNADGSTEDEPALHSISNASSIPGCILPEQPTGGSFDLDLCGDAAGERVSIGSVLVYRCHDGYALQGNNVSVCYANVWNPPTTCIKTCPLLKSTSVDIVYKYKREIISSVAAIVPGTKAILTCKNFYEIQPADDPAYREITCLGEGVWDRPLFRCLSECGTLESRGNSPETDESVVYTHGSFPWHVDIYKRSSTGTFEQTCVGTLISPHLVVSAARCFYDEIVSRVIDASFFEVTPGKDNLSHNVSDRYATYSPVKRIDVAERYIGSIGNHVGDIALLLLEKPFNITPWIKPICIDWENKYEMEQLEKGKSGKTVIWNIAGVTRSEVHEIISHPYIPYRECVAGACKEFVSYVTADKFCAGYANDSDIHDVQNGSGLYFESDGLWYLRGIAAVRPARNTCINNYGMFTNVASFMKKIRTVYLNTGSQSVGQPSPVDDGTTAVTQFTRPTVTNLTSDCILPELPINGTFVLVSRQGQCNSRNKPGTRVPIGSTLVYSCDEGYSVEGMNVATCRDIGWNRTPACVKHCPALSSKTVDFVCRYLGKSVSCENSLIPGTEVTLACKNFYTILSTHDPGYRKTTCLRDGTWDRPVFQCIPDCSRAVVGGQVTWNVRIYVKNSAGSFSPVRQGTLISPGLVITVTAWNLIEREKFVIASNCAVVAGATTAIPYNTDEPHVQKSLVRRVDLQKDHRCSVDDCYVMALLHLDSPFIMTAQVNPICLDWYKDTVTPAYIIPYEECLSQVGWAQRKYVTAGTSCEDQCKLDARTYRTNSYNSEYVSGGLWYLWSYLIATADLKNGDCSKRYIETSVRYYLDWIWAAYYNSTG